jgi:hypothetical protein
MKVLFKNLISWWEFEGRYYPKQFYIGIKNLIKWFPTIWRDRDYDPSYIYDIISKKLEFQSKGIGSRDILVSSQRNSEIMKTCINLIKRINDDFYGSEYIDYYENDIWFEDINGNDELFYLKSNIISEKLDDYFNRYPLIYKRVLNGEGPFQPNCEVEMGNKELIAMNISHINQNRARKLLFKILESQIERWWC